MKFKEGQLIIKIINPETDDRKVEKGGIVKVLSSSSHYEYDLLVEVVKSKNLPIGMSGIVDSSQFLEDLDCNIEFEVVRPVGGIILKRKPI